ncbi:MULTISPECIES: SDR family oxidoreductase [Streptomyces]|uniref:dTDP-4-dehydrorhamnose reductase n=1 Tax=Streptomyces chartreusis NRRL 3882 TaxID=1079985 RepID=A0A2N9B3C9_STRCX|nr:MULTISPECIES: sugar nucleotide-binding protein [Streptomyces]MYS89715.1 sugar nucleotide-binding protein [Streptomyces sp. SID5464]SOR77840.1 dTDP-4-dehydrorhamnose reductase [Streptomyces chartreusis NRRL 3882]
MRTLVVGSGFVGSALAGRLARAGDEAVLASRTPPASPADGVVHAWVPLDITEDGAFGRALERVRADTVVLVHGPSDVTWCEEHPEEATHGHAEAARQVVRAAGNRRVVFISTDNVFDADAGAPDESVPPRPANAYGRAKLAAEQILAELPAVTLLRVSLIYGWEPATSTKWLNFFASCVHRLRAGERVTAPFDQWTTPVLLDDVVEVTTALARAESPPRLLHLGGPDRLSRAEWAALIAEELGASPALVTAEPRENGRYAGRPASTCLSSGLLATHPATADLAPRPVREGSRLLIDRHTSPTPRSTV